MDNVILGSQDSGYSVGDIMANPLGPGLGKPSSNMQDAQTQALLNATMIPKALWENTATMRGNITSLLDSFTSGNMDVTSMPAFAPGKSSIEDVYSKAKENLISETPAGGALTQGMADIESTRAKSLTDLIGEIQDSMLRMAYSAGYGTPATAMQGANQASSNFNDYMNAANANASNNAAGLASLIAYLAG